MQAGILNNTLQHARPVRHPNFITRHPVLSAVVITYLLTWAVLIPQALASQKILSFAVPPFVEFASGWAPAFGAIFVAGLLEGRAGIVALLRRFLIVRVGPVWYLAALFGMAVVILGGIGLFVLSGGSLPVIPALHVTVPTFIFVLVISLALGSLFNTEEVLWRGFILPRLQTRHSALAAALIIAVPETILHLPYFFIKNVAFYQNVGVVAFALFAVAAATLYSWLFNNTRGSLLLVTLAHASQNAWANLLSDNQAIPFYWTVALLGLVALVVIIVFGPARLARHPVAPATGLSESGNVSATGARA